MIQEKINRINALAKKAKSEGLTDEERAEQQQLRKEYIESFRRSLECQLDNTFILRPDGTKQKVTKHDDFPN